MKSLMATGIYVSVPFCRTKCSYCNFASDVFSRSFFQRYVDRVCSDLQHASATADMMGGDLDPAVDSIYIGGGTPTILDSQQLRSLFVTIRQNFRIQPDAEITVECAPGTLAEETLDTLVQCGVNRVSLGVQSFVDQECAAVGRQHRRKTVLEDAARLRAAGIPNISIDLIAGLPHQTPDSWRVSLQETIASGVPHVSVYMLEVDDDSRLGRELIAGGTRYHAHFVPDEDLTADLYLYACAELEKVGITQYEISNFARPGFESRHNLKYWTRQPYMGFGVDAHSMLAAAPDGYALVSAASQSETPPSGGSRPCQIADLDLDAVRFSTADSLDAYIAGAPLSRISVSRRGALEETFFLGLRLTRGLDLDRVVEEFGADAVRAFDAEFNELLQEGLLVREAGSIRLSSRGKLLSNEVFQRFLGVEATVR